MNSLPHGELFNMALHYLVQWVADGVAPPRAERIEVGPDGCSPRTSTATAAAGVRCVEMDVPRLRYFANPKNEDGTPAFGVVGTEEPSRARDSSNSSTATTTTTSSASTAGSTSSIDQGWLLAEDAEDLRNEAEKAEVP